MSIDKPRYTKKFKAFAVKLANESNETAARVAQHLEISPNKLSKWICKENHRQANDNTIRTDEYFNELKRKLARLNEDYYSLKYEYDLLKETYTYFTKEQHELSDLFEINTRKITNKEEELQKIIKNYSEKENWEQSINKNENINHHFTHQGIMAIKDILKNSIVLISGKNSTVIGTGFVFWKEGNSYYVLTCAHVIEEIRKENNTNNCYKEEISVAHLQEVELVALGDKNGIDLAVLRVNDLQKETLKLCNMVGQENINCQISGYSLLTGDNKLKNKVGKNIQGKATDGIIVSEYSLDAWELSIDDKFSLVEGYSGAPVIDKNTGKVFAVATIAEHDGNRGFAGKAISITNLLKIWEDAPVELIESLSENHQLASEVNESMFNQTEPELAPLQLQHLILETVNNLGNKMPDKRVFILDVVKKVSSEVSLQEEAIKEIIKRLCQDKYLILHSEIKQIQIAPKGINSL